jgi:hypothetical protein
MVAMGGVLEELNFHCPHGLRWSAVRPMRSGPRPGKADWVHLELCTT